MPFLRKIVITFFVFILFLGVSFANSNFDAKLNIFKNYLENKLLNIEKIVKNYELEDSKKIKNNLAETKKLIRLVKIIKGSNIAKNKENLVINSLKNKINILNKDIKKSLKKEIKNYKINLKRKKENYDKISLKLEKSLKKIVENIYNKKIKNKSFSKKEENLTNILLRIKNNIVKLKNFRKMEFKSTKSMKIIFVNILKNIKKELSNLKNNL